jgi:hypothetical protein
MDEERTEAARTARQTSMQNPTELYTQSLRSPPVTIYLPIAPQAPTPTQPSTPSQPAFASGSGSPQRKRRRTSAGESTPEPLPRDDELHAFVGLVNTTYEVRAGEDGSGGPGTKQLVCKGCE